ncbi:MAG TPA: hypothetical protein P5560_03450 [Thermotogota bacterium]|nr:hypothetical protein [Thermotogota bacterium]HRW91984.1 hypothetical protein [Thermotogota bacterium]
MRKLRGEARFWGILALLSCLPFFLGGCFLLEMVFPPFEKGTPKLAVYLHYGKTRLDSHRFQSLEFVVDSVQMAGQTLQDDQTVTIRVQPAQTLTSLPLFFESTPFLGQFSFTADEPISNPRVRLTLKQNATLTYLENVEETAVSTSIAVTINASSRVMDYPIKVLEVTEFKTRSLLSLPIGQSQLIVFLNLATLPLLSEVDPLVPVTLGASFGMLSGDSTLLYGQLRKNASSVTPRRQTLEPGEGVVVSYEDWNNLFFTDNPFSAQTYPVNGSTDQQGFFCIVPRQSQSTYDGRLSYFFPEEIISATDVRVTINQAAISIPTLLFPLGGTQ